jgi:DNA-directed RNA polymerase specialized sigma24 family protein
MSLETERFDAEPERLRRILERPPSEWTDRETRALLSQLQTHVRSWCRRHQDCSQEADDLLQDSTLQLLRCSKRAIDPVKSGIKILHSLVFYAIQYAARRRRRLEESLPLLNVLAHTRGASEYPGVQRDESLDFDAFARRARLSAFETTVVMSMVLDEQSAREAAAALGVTPDAAGLHRIRQAKY